MVTVVTVRAQDRRIPASSTSLGVTFLEKTMETSNSTRYFKKAISLLVIGLRYLSTEIIAWQGLQAITRRPVGCCRRFLCNEAFQGVDSISDIALKSNRDVALLSAEMNIDGTGRMNIQQPRLHSVARAVALACACPGMALSVSAFAFNVDSGSSDLAISWDNTLKYSAGWRVRDVNPAVAPAGTAGFTPQINTNDGDRNFSRGLVSNRFDILSELGVRYRRDSGFRISAAAWYDDVYQHDNDRNVSDAPGLNQSGPYNQFNKRTRIAQGRNAELLDAFAYTRQSLGEMNLNLKVGRFTQLYGETLFLGNNGIAGAQTPLDLSRALSVPNSQFKEVARPVGQISGQLQLTPDVIVGAYYQGEWRKSRLPAAGSYFSFADFVDDGGEILYTPFGPALRGSDIEPKNSGQGGAQVRVRSGDTEYGLYAATFHEKLPQFYARFNAGPAGVVPADYVMVYGQNIRTVGGSFSTVLGETNVAGEVSYRTNMPLVAAGSFVFPINDPAADGDANARFPKGDTLHLNLSTISVLGANALWGGASFLGEFAFNRRLRVTDNPAALEPNATRDAGAIQFVFTPEYFQVLPETDLQIPIGVSYGLFGRSSVNGVLFPAEHGGSLSVGAKAMYQKAWQFSLNYTHYIGTAGSVATTTGLNSYQNFHGDRDFVSLSVQRAF